MTERAKGFSDWMLIEQFADGVTMREANLASRAWQASRKQALEEERSWQYKLADALQELLSDTQHVQHESCEDGGYCPVRDARLALEDFIERDNAIRSLSIPGRNQCDGCARGLPTNAMGIHKNGPEAVMSCTADRYLSTPDTEGGKG